MSSLVDFQIRDLSRNLGMVEPFESEQVCPASYDVRLGNMFKREGRICGPDPKRWTDCHLEKDEEFELYPGHFVLAHTLEYVRLPNDIEAQFQLKSSRAREGIQHLFAGFLDPGFHGQVTLELKNVTMRHTVILKPGMLIGQLRFAQLSEKPMRPYSLTGRYMNDLGAVESKG